MTTLDTIFSAVPGSAEFVGARGLVRIRGSVDGHPSRGSFIALGDGSHKVALTPDLRAQTGHGAGDEITVHLDQRIPPTTRKTSTR